MNLQLHLGCHPGSTVEVHTVDSAVYACSGLVASSCKLVRRRNQPVPQVAAAFPGIPAAHEGVQGSLSHFILFYFQGARPLRPDRQARTYREIKNAPPWIRMDSSAVCTDLGGLY